MEEKDQKNPTARMVRPANLSIKRRALIRNVLVICGVLLVVILVANFLTNTKKSNSEKLIDTVTKIENSSTCSEGLKKIEPKTSATGNSVQYNNAAREKILSYLMSCTFQAGNTSKALSYATQLNKLYTQDGNKQAQQQLTQSINYMKSYGH